MNRVPKVVSEAIVKANGLDLSTFLIEDEGLEGIVIENGMKDNLIIFFVDVMTMRFPIGMEAINFDIPEVGKVTNLNARVLKIRSCQFNVLDPGVNDLDLLPVFCKQVTREILFLPDFS
jgi:hypothetical protein